MVVQMWVFRVALLTFYVQILCKRIVLLSSVKVISKELYSHSGYKFLNLQTLRFLMLRGQFVVSTAGGWIMSYVVITGVRCVRGTI